MNSKIFHILVVDDDNRIRELVKEYLEENQFLVTTARNAEDAKKKLEILKFDLFFQKKDLSNDKNINFR